MYATTNAPESANLSKDDLQIFEAGRAAAQSLSKTFELWMTIARAVELAKTKAAKIGRRDAFQRILEQQGLAGVLGNNWNSQKNTASKLMMILEHLSEVTAWRETLTPHQRITWAAPTTVYKHCPAFITDGPEREPRAKVEKRRDTALAELAVENVAVRKGNEAMDRYVQHMENELTVLRGENEIESLLDLKEENARLKIRIAELEKQVTELRAELENLRGPKAKPWEKTAKAEPDPEVEEGLKEFATNFKLGKTKAKVVPKAPTKPRGEPPR